MRYQWKRLLRGRYTHAVIRALTLLLICQLAGEILVRAIGMPMPGPVLGMLFLFLILVIRKASWPALDQSADTLLRNLSLLFVPAAVGVIQHGATLGTYWLALSVALIVSTVLTLTVTALVFRLVASRSDPDGRAASGERV